VLGSIDTTVEILRCSDQPWGSGISEYPIRDHAPGVRGKAAYHCEFGIAARLLAERDGLRESSIYWSVKAHQCAIQQIPKDNPVYHIVLHSLAITLHVAFHVTGEMAYLCDAISIARNTFQLTDHQRNRQMVEEGRRLFQQICNYETYDNVFARSNELYCDASDRESFEGLPDNKDDSSFIDHTIGDGDDGRSIIIVEGHKGGGISGWWRQHRR
jgi:hypothetical protein